MKAEIRIPTTQYGYINIIVEQKDGYDLENIVGLHNEAVKEYANSLKTPENGSKINLEPKELRRVTDTFFLENRMSEEDNTKLGTEKIYSQQDLFKWASNSFTRIKAKGEVGTRAEDPYRTITRD